MVPGDARLPDDHPDPGAGGHRPVRRPAGEARLLTGRPPATAPGQGDQEDQPAGVPELIFLTRYATPALTVGESAWADAERGSPAGAVRHDLGRHERERLGWLA